MQLVVDGDRVAVLRLQVMQLLSKKSDLAILLYEVRSCRGRRDVVGSELHNK